jgi:hypothetical protein
MKKIEKINILLYLIPILLFQILVYNIRPDLEDKMRYRELIQFVNSFDFIFVTKEPVFNLFAIISGYISEILFDTAYYSVEIINLISSVILSIAVYRIHSKNKFAFLIGLSFYVSYDFIYLVAETMRLHLALSLFLLAFSFRNSSLFLRNLLLVIATLTHFSIGLLIMANILKSNKIFYLILILIVINVILLININPNIPIIGITFSEIAGFDVPSSRRYVWERLILYSFIIMITIYYIVEDPTVKKNLITIIVFGYLLYLMNFIEMGIRINSIGIILSLIFGVALNERSRKNSYVIIAYFLLSLILLSFSPLEELLYLNIL